MPSPHRTPGRRRRPGDIHRGSPRRTAASATARTATGTGPRRRNRSVWHTASGTTALALLTREEIETQFRANYEHERGDSGIPLDTAVDSPAAVRERGYAYAIDELEPGAAAVATAFRVPSGTVYAVWVGGPSFRITPRAAPALGALTQRADAEIERLVHFDEGLVSSAV